MAPPPSTAGGMAALLLRILTLAFLLVSLIILTTDTATLVLQANTGTTQTDLIAVKVHFRDVYAYRYLLAATVMGLAYTILQMFFTLRRIASGNCSCSGDGYLRFDFYGDKLVSYLLATGAAAAFGSTSDMKPLFSGSGTTDKFFNKGYASASLVLLGFVCTALLSIRASYAFPKTFQ